VLNEPKIPWNFKLLKKKIIGLPTNLIEKGKKNVIGAPVGSMHK